MKAIIVRQFGPPDVMKLEEVPALTPGPGQVLVRVKAIGVNPVETYVRAGTYARKPNLPYTPGSDLAGIVEAVGPDVTSVKTGDRVYSHGTAGTGA
jgi:NADPH2:quinone reductase